MNKISYNLRGNVLCHDAAILLDGEGALETVYESVVGSISTDVEILFEDGVKVSLAMLEDPDQWESDWQDLGIEDPYEYIASLATDRDD